MTVDGVDCPINTNDINDSTRITCITGPKPEAERPSILGPQPGSPGVVRTRFDTESRHVMWNRDSAGWAKPGPEHIIDEQLRTGFETEINEIRSNHEGLLMEGWFLAPRDGEYRFYMACDDQCKLWLDQNPYNANNPQPPNPQLIAHNYNAMLWRDYLQPPDENDDNKNYISDWIHLSAGQYYYLEGY